VHGKEDQNEGIEGGGSKFCLVLFYPDWEKGVFVPSSLETVGDRGSKGGRAAASLHAAQLCILMAVVSFVGGRETAYQNVSFLAPLL
jgi:hypothetical protein